MARLKRSKKPLRGPGMTGFDLGNREKKGENRGRNLPQCHKKTKKGGEKLGAHREKKNTLNST